MKEASSSFLKKRTKKLLVRFAPWGEVSGQSGPYDGPDWPETSPQGAKRTKSFCALFSKSAAFLFQVA
jgi:hypothetical protein